MSGHEPSSGERSSRGAGPRWRQVQMELERAIESGQFPRGARLPTEDELARRFEVHRHTIRRAIGRLREKQMVRVEQGRGTFVRDRDISYRMERNSLLRVAAMRGERKATWKILETTETRADREVAAGLALPVGHPVRQMYMLRVIDEEPMSVSLSWYPLPRFAGIEEAIRETGSVTVAMQRYGIPEIPKKSTAVRAVMPTLREARLLNLSRHKPLLELRIINVDRSGVPVQYLRSRHNSDMLNLVFEF
ncbi:transcriptional regulator, GntR family [Ancylobacter novellus DSM 506]|uniref:Transcriptional regulator, GntR family n=1 Tax=Ancylobacter novellus (strain ATCC 8093 / DSM 506 / JCM 20403 / CCM 1077 / IAM 12100 / NBRC 12443 / NCIMB 10456) TaxID=639283 RepID=D7A6U7_ANCN5|nr:phosphonate metabolism transcriptional regulator PhnF [Ancylobacter novellus]ADH88321.1 transcriptional regulator, GntR family [Ancylobacter novellus DSM 506]